MHPLPNHLISRHQPQMTLPLCVECDSLGLTHCNSPSDPDGLLDLGLLLRVGPLEWLLEPDLE